MSGTQGDLVSAQLRRTAPHRVPHRDQAGGEPEEIIDYTAHTMRQLASLDDDLELGRTIALHAAEVIATPVLPAPPPSDLELQKLRRRVDQLETTAKQQADRLEVLESGWRLAMRRLGVSSIDLDDIR